MNPKPYRPQLTSKHPEEEGQGEREWVDVCSKVNIFICLAFDRAVRVLEGPWLKIWPHQAKPVASLQPLHVMSMEPCHVKHWAAWWKSVLRISGEERRKNQGHKEWAKARANPFEQERSWIIHICSCDKERKLMKNSWLEHDAWRLEAAVPLKQLGSYQRMLLFASVTETNH